MSEAQRAEWKAKNAALARAAIDGVGKGISKADNTKADSEGSDALLAQPVAQTLAAGMTTENFSKDVSTMSDADLANINLSTPDAKAAAQHN